MCFCWPWQTQTNRCVTIHSWRKRCVCFVEAVLFDVAEKIRPHNGRGTVHPTLAGWSTTIVESNPVLTNETFIEDTKAKDQCLLWQQ